MLFEPEQPRGLPVPLLLGDRPDLKLLVQATASRIVAEGVPPGVGIESLTFTPGAMNRANVFGQHPREVQHEPLISASTVATRDHVRPTHTVPFDSAFSLPSRKRDTSGLRASQLGVMVPIRRNVTLNDAIA